MKTSTIAILVGVVGLAGCGDNLAPPPAAPRAVIDDAPAALSSATHVAIGFHAEGAASGFTCVVDRGAGTACTSPWSINVGDGDHRVDVIPLDADGEAGERATATFATDTTAPAIAIVAPMIAARTGDPRPVVSFTADDPHGAHTTCSVDGGPAAACDGSFRAAAALAEGAHGYQVAATDDAGNSGHVDVAFIVDVTPPSVVIDSGPGMPTNDTSPRFLFTASADTTRARCALDTGEVVDPCTSGVRFLAVMPGARTFTVTAFDDATPANSASASYAFFLGVCGDHTAQGSERCDGPDLGGETCVGLGFTAGTLACAPGCDYDTHACTGCGNGVLEAGEACDSNLLGGATCVTRGFDSGTLHCSNTCAFDDSGCGHCGNGVIDGGEACDGAQLGAATCAGLGHAPGTLSCATGCGGFVTTGCDGGFTAAGEGFTGRVAPGGLRFGRSTQFLALAAEDTGAWKLSLTGPLTWAAANGATLNNLHARALFTPLDNPAVVVLTDNSGAFNGFRSNNFESTTQPPSSTTWTQLAFASGGVPLEMTSTHTGSSTNNLIGGWSAGMGAVVLHGNFATTAVASAVGANVNGSVTLIAAGAFSLPSTDLLIAVNGRTPAGAAATGGGIYWTCDLNGTTGGTFVEHDTGIPAADRALVWSLTPDPGSFNAGLRMCPTTGGQVSGYAATSYAALRGGGQIYKTDDGGASWTASATGLPAGAEVFDIAIDCSRLAAGFPNLCVDRTLLYAATSVGLYRSTDAGAHWSLAGLEGKVVRAVTLPSDHPVGTAPRVFAAVDDAIGVYQRSVP